ncbi:MAG: hypothetical protein O2779_05325 [Nanoarchaeota archaeon]|nr:hypothetical protein [Nanoarchaeota archaeon]
MKKGSLTLSTTAIVTLILAIVMLGLGLGFIRGNFSKSATQFDEQTSSRVELLSPIPSNPLVISKEVVIADPGSTFRIDVGVKNPTHEDWGEAYPVVTCS